MGNLNRVMCGIVCIASFTIITFTGRAAYATNVNKEILNPYDINNYKRTIGFSGYEFKVKDSSISESGRLGPNNNIFSDCEENVMVDSYGRLVLKMTNEDNLWKAVEVISKDDFGYGRYVFKIASRIDNIDKNVMFSPFLYKDDENEIDIEFSDFGNHNSQFIVQPFYIDNHIETFTSKLNGSYTSYVLDYNKSSIKFGAYHGHNFLNKYNLINEWTYKGKDIPKPDGMKLRFNLYIRNGERPSNDSEQEMIITDFKYTPYEYKGKKL